ncbi:MAG: M48 family metalloprotease [Candidatus Eremiobacteraeota bacterium]|nr:M48 family metalloprotease [Candidatus Eremiobacteraeota bacterium]
MNARTFLVGIGSGLSAGYVAYRASQAWNELRTPRRPMRPDPAAYGRHRRALAVAAIVRSTAATAAFAFGRGADRLDRLTATPWVWLRPVTFTAVAQLADALIELPVDFVEEYSLERRYGLSEQTREAWFADRAKETLVSTLVTSVLAGMFVAVLRRFPKTWPYLAGAGVLPLLLLVNVAVPLWIMPLFNRFEPLSGPLESRLRALAERYGCADADILRVDMSRQTKKANAYVTGIGRTHRIVAGDTLLERFPADEVEFVVAHELGHYVSRDSWRLIGVSQVLALLLLSGASLAVRKDVAERPEHPRTLMRVFFWLSLLSQLFRPAVCAFSRSREWAADRFAVTATNAPLTGAAAFGRLRDQNLAEPEQPAWYEFFFSTHPSLKARIDALESAGPQKARASG